ncbi:RICIN domain-containing protein [Streptomyces broussonetiae]|uniref:RICIN domain-containing protein n=1 Tax=Streptomyces broussonetiae TaxID=2686304 RepID=A0ABV5EEG5_9ACTN
MPKPEGETPSPSPAVRRASVLPAVAAEPGPALAPPSGARGAAREEGDDATTAITPGTAPDSETPPEPVSSAHAAQAAQTVPTSARSAPDNTTAPDPATSSATATSATAPAPPAEGRTAVGDDGTTPGRPTKPLLAAAAIVGTVLVGVPLVLLGRGVDDDPGKPDRAQVLGGTYLPGDGDGGGGGAGTDRYAASSPSTTPQSPPAKQPEKGAESAPPEEPGKAAALPATTPTEGAESPSTAPSGSPAPKRKTQTVRTTGPYVPQGADFRTTARLLVKNVMTGMCVDVPGYGKGTPDGPVNQFPCARTGDNQLWDLVVTGDGAGPSGADLFVIRNSVDGYCLDLPDYGGRASGTPVSEYHCNGTIADNQLWYLDKRSEGKFWIRSYSSGNRCLDVSGFNGVGGRDARLTIYDCAASDDHLWSFS